MRRLGLVGTVLLALLVATADADARKLPTCGTKHAKVLVRTRSLLVYWRSDHDGFGTRSVYACARRVGRERKLGSRVHLQTSDEDTTILAYARVYLVVETAVGDQYASAARTRWWNVATGRTRTLYSFDSPPGGSTITMGVPLDRALLSSNGCGLLAHSTDSTAHTATVLTATFRGPRAELDRGTADAIPATSLALRGHTATWSNAGVQRSADLAPASC